MKRSALEHGRHARLKAARSDDVGATFIEFAIVAIVLFLLIFGAFDFGIFLNNREDIRHGIRDAARMVIVQNATTNPLPAGGCTLTGVTSSNSAPLPPTGVDKDLLCLIKNKVISGNTNARVSVSFDGNADIGDHLTICAMYPTNGATPLIQSFIPTRVVSRVVVRLEQPFPDTNAYQEAASAGTWTSFC